MSVEQTHKHSAEARPNTPLELTPLRVEQDQVDFDSRYRLDCFAGLSVRRNSAAARSAASTTHRKLISIVWRSMLL
jgi:hypothetical protein